MLWLLFVVNTIGSQPFLSPMTFAAEGPKPVVMRGLELAVMNIL
jgi:hypothetical protein